MIPLNYHHLYYFWTTAKKGSINQASKDLLLTQSTLSQQLAQLERALKTQLFHRGRDGVQLTQRGRSIFAHCQRIFTSGEALERFLQEGDTGALLFRIGISTAVSREIILSIRRFIGRSKSPMRTFIFTGSSAGLKERLARHQLDLAVSETDLSSELGPTFRGRLVDSVAMNFVAAPALAKGFNDFPNRTRPVRMLLRTPENQIRKDVESVLQRKRARFEVVMETEDADLIRIMALQGEGVAALSPLAAQRDLEQGRLVKLNRRPTGVREYIWFVMPAGGDPPTDAERLASDLTSRFKAIWPGAGRL